MVAKRGDERVVYQCEDLDVRGCGTSLVFEGVLSNIGKEGVSSGSSELGNVKLRACVPHHAVERTREGVGRLGLGPTRV